MVDRFDFFKRLPRAEPGGVTFTGAYVGIVPVGPDDTIIDLHARCGERSVWLARSRRCRVLAVDHDERFAQNVKKAAYDGGAGHQIETFISRYDNLSLETGAASLLIAEWAAIFTGLENGLVHWKRFVPIDGFVAISYPGVINKDAPREVRGPFEKRMVEPMRTLADYHAIAQSAGYEIVHQAPLSHDLWENHYTDVVRRAWALNGGRNKPSASPLIQELIDEADWYRRVGRGRVFLQSMLLRRTA